MASHGVLTVALGLGLVFATGCNGPTGGARGTQSTGTLSGPTSGFASCAPSSTPGQLCLGLKVYSYLIPGTDSPVVDSDEAERLVQTANDFWKQCNIAFQIDEYTAIDAESAGLPTGSSIQAGTNEIRQALGSSNELLLVLTEGWNANTVGWTNMPDTTPYGAVLDGEWVASSGHAGEITVAHELGHYQGLDHVSDPGDLMYPQAVSTANALTADQCATARATDQSLFTAMLRR